MPPKKRTACNPRKPRLTFLESPQEGPLHEYGPAPPRAEKTKSVPTKPLDLDSSTSWVSPQFDQAVELHFPARLRRRHASGNSTAHSRGAGAERSQQRAPRRKQSVCKFPSLSFSAAEIIETQSFCSTRRRVKENWRVPTPVPASPPSPREPSYGNTRSPPDIPTPQNSPPCAAHIQTPGTGPDTPLARSPGRVLAEDTPEHEYGIRPTWRRRQGLMRYLKSRGRLGSSQIRVKP